MSTPTPNDIRFARLAALADVDADATLNTASRDAASVDAGGEAALKQRISEQHNLREACSRVMDGPAHRCPDELRTRLTAATAEPAQRAAVIGRIGPRRWVAVLAAAALIAVSTGAVVGSLKTLRSAPQALSTSIAQVINTGQASAFDRRHGVCGADPSQLFRTKSFPESLGELKNNLNDVLGADFDSAQLDLSALGYHYRGAGHCLVPGPGAVHMVYRNDAGQALSLWLRPNDGRLDLAQGQVYGPPADGPQAGRILIWRDGDVVLYLVGDLPEDVQQARPQFALHPA